MRFGAKSSSSSVAGAVSASAAGADSTTGSAGSTGSAAGTDSTTGSADSTGSAAGTDSTTGSANSTFGSLLKNAPANGPNPCVDTVPGPCTLVGYINPNDAGDPVTSPAPYDGVVVKVRIRSAAAESVTFGFATIDAPQNGVANAQITAHGPTVTLQGTGEIE